MNTPLKYTMILITLGALACQTGVRKENTDGVRLPFIKNDPNECYYLDDFMPIPNNLVSGRSGSLSVRYYTYDIATYKDWPEASVVLSFYSKDVRCWSLFEEYYILE